MMGVSCAICNADMGMILGFHDVHLVHRQYMKVKSIDGNKIEGRFVHVCEACEKKGIDERLYVKIRTNCKFGVAIGKVDGEFYVVSCTSCGKEILRTNVRDKTLAELEEDVKAIHGQ